MKTFRFILLAVLLTAVTSCATYKRLGYFQDMEPGVAYSMPQQPDAHIAKGDKLNIVVSCSTPTLAAPFNIASGVQAVDPTSAAGSSEVRADAVGARLTGGEMDEGYLVDESGNINFPVLGIVHVEGMTLKELKEDLESQILSSRYIKDPYVHVSFVNFQITFLGEVGSGNYTVPNGRINMFEALAMVGDLTEDAQRDDIWVIRTVDGKRRLYTINLKTKDCFYSPVFFLQQNDMIYVKPKNNKMDSAIDAGISVFTTILQTLMTGVNSVLFFKYLFN